jgi:hypothetical protein
MDFNWLRHLISQRRKPPVKQVIHEVSQTELDLIAERILMDILLDGEIEQWDGKIDPWDYCIETGYWPEGNY